MKYFTVFLFLIFSLTLGCKKDGSQQDQHTSKDAEAINGADDYEKEDPPSIDLVKEMEPEDRVIWQKPDLVISKLGNIQDKTIVDIGAGTGYFTFRLARKGAKVIAVDIDSEAIAWMEKQKERYPEAIRNRVDIRLATEMDAGLSTHEADLALLVNTYIYIEDRINYMRNLKSGLKAGSQIVIVDFKKKNTPLGPDLEQRISMLELENELIEAGFEIIAVDDTSLDYQYFVSAIYRGD